MQCWSVLTVRVEHLSVLHCRLRVRVGVPFGFTNAVSRWPVLLDGVVDVPKLQRGLCLRPRLHLADAGQWPVSRRVLLDLGAVGVFSVPRGVLLRPRRAITVAVSRWPVQ